MFSDVELTHLLDVYLDALLVVLRIDVGFYLKARGGGRCPDVFPYGIETIQGAPRPVFADFTEEPVFDGIPLGGSRRIVTHRDFNPVPVTELLQLVLPCSATIAVAAAAVRQNEQFLRFRITTVTIVSPPFFDGRDSELRRVMRRTDKDRSPVGLDVIDAVRNRETKPLGAEVMIFHRDRLFVPCHSGVFEIAHQLFLFCVIATLR